MHDNAAIKPSESPVGSRSLASAATWQLLGLVSILFSIILGGIYFWRFLEYDLFKSQTLGNKHLEPQTMASKYLMGTTLSQHIQHDFVKPQTAGNKQLMETASPYDIPQMLGKIHVSISFQYTVERLHILYENLATISRWDTTADVCIGTNAPEKVLIFLQSPPLATEFTRKVSMCPVQNLDMPLLLNWRTRESMERAFLSPLDYTAFIFVEDDLYVTWEALLKWEEDTQILQHHNFMRTFFRYEFSPQDGQLHSADYHGQGAHRVINFSLGDDTDDDAKKNGTSFVQLGDAMTYSGMFIATREQMSHFIASPFWSCKSYSWVFYIILLSQI